MQLTRKDLHEIFTEKIYRKFISHMTSKTKRSTTFVLIHLNCQVATLSLRSDSFELSSGFSFYDFINWSLIEVEFFEEKDLKSLFVF